MNNHSKKIALVLALMLIMPVSAFAEKDSERSSNGIRLDGGLRGGLGSLRMDDDHGPGRPMIGIKGDVRGNGNWGDACAFLPLVGTKFDAVVDGWTKGGGASVGVHAEARDARKDNRSQYWDGTIKNTRGSWDIKRQEGYKKMLDAADTDAEKAAVVEFKADVEAAIAKKRAAIDAWVIANKSAHDDWQTKNRANVEAAYKTFAADVRAAIAEAEASCDAGKSSADVTMEFKADIEAARAKLKASLDTDAKTGWSEKKHEELKKIITDFQEDLKDAKMQLEASYDLKMLKK